MPVVLALALLALLAAPASAACPQQARCGTLRVPLDHSGATAGTLPLQYAVLPATGPRTGTLVLLTGGPGEQAVGYGDELRRELAPLRAAHDLVLVDQRGTGGSGATRCDPVEFSGDCADKLGAKRPFLTTVETARDLEDLRVALGADRLTLLGVSYGTKVAQEYLRRFPDRTAAVILDSPVSVGPIDVDNLSGLAALPRVLRELCASGPCARTVKDPAAALTAAVRRVRRRPVRGPEVERKGRVETRLVSELAVYHAAAFADSLGPYRADLPAALQSLARGDAAPLLHLRQLDFLRPLPDFDEAGFSFSRFHATLCLEGGLPWTPDSALETRADADDAYLRRIGTGPFAPFSVATVRTSGAVRPCSDWPSTPAPEPPPATVPDVPVLVLSGRLDLVTPLETARLIAAEHPRVTLLEVPHAGHSLVGSHDCARAAVATFLVAGTPQACDGIAPERAASPYTPATLRGVRTVAQATLDGIRRDLEAAREYPRARYELPGLRGGYTRVTRGRLDLRRVEWVRGVRVSGRVSAAGNGRLTLSGAVRGTVRVRAFAARP